MSRPRLVYSTPAPEPVTVAPDNLLPTQRHVSGAIQAEAANLRARLATAMRPLTGRSSTDKALGQAKAELYALATDLQRLAKRL